MPDTLIPDAFANSSTERLRRWSIGGSVRAFFRRRLATLRLCTLLILRLLLWLCPVHRHAVDHQLALLALVEISHDRVAGDLGFDNNRRLANPVWRPLGEPLGHRLVKTPRNAPGGLLRILTRRAAISMDKRGERPQARPFLIVHECLGRCHAEPF